MNRTDLDGLLRVVRPAEEPSARDRETVRQGLQRRIAAHAPEPELPPLDSAGSWRAKWPLALGSVAGVAGVIALGLWLGRREPLATHAPLERAGTARLPAPREAQPDLAEEPEFEPLPAPAVASPRPAAASKRKAAPLPAAATATRAARGPSHVEAGPAVTSPTLNLAAESRGLGEVQAALRDGKPARALELLSVQDQQFAGGVLVEERAAARAMALCAAAQHAAGRSAAAAFARSYPNSALGARVRRACAKDTLGKESSER